MIVPTAVPAGMTACEISDGTTDFDLASIDSIVGANQSNTVTCHVSKLEAGNGANPLPIPYIAEKKG